MNDLEKRPESYQLAHQSQHQAQLSFYRKIKRRLQRENFDQLDKIMDLYYVLSSGSEYQWRDHAKQQSEFILRKVTIRKAYPTSILHRSTDEGQQPPRHITCLLSSLCSYCPCYSPTEPTFENLLDATQTPGNRGKSTS